MPNDNPEAEATEPTRRTFLARAALGGAFATVAAAGPLGRLLPASAQDGSGGATLTDGQVAVQLAPIELAAVQAYEAAASGGALDVEWAVLARAFQSHHLVAAERLDELRGPDDPEPLPDPTIVEGTVATIRAASDQDAVLSALAELEDLLAATHLWAIGDIPDQVTARLLSQILTIESQQAVALGRAAGTSVDDLTPATVTPADGLLQAPAPEPDDTPTDDDTTEEAGS